MLPAILEKMDFLSKILTKRGWQAKKHAFY